jgi:hypothetical protein
LIQLILYGLAVLWLVQGIRGQKKQAIAGGLVLGGVTFVAFQFMMFWTEMLWFESLGFNARFWTEVGAKAGFLIAGALFALAVVWLSTARMPGDHNTTRLWSRLLATVVGALWGLSNWDTLLIYLNRVDQNIFDPLLGKDVGFYLFSLPFYDALYGLLLMMALISVVSVLAGTFFSLRQGQVVFTPVKSNDQKSFQPLWISTAFLILVLAAGKYLSRFHLLYSDWGAVSGAGWTDTHIRLPAYTVVVVIMMALAIVVLIRPLRSALERWLSKWARNSNSALVLIGGIAGFVIGLWLLVLTLVPGLFQWLRVEPNEITMEKEYIRNNIQFTRQAFKLDGVEEKEFPASEEFTRETVEKNQYLVNNIRLWDWRALDAVYKQFQEIRLYYEFKDVDIDRYTFDGAYRQVMVSAREMEQNNLPPQSQTFVNKRFKYTHGYGITLTTVSDFTPQGLPNLLVKDIPPQVKYPALQVDRPEIYYGELTGSHVIVNSAEKEFDYPSGEQNVYTRYNGSGGVRMSNFWRKFIFGYRFDGTRLLLSGYPTSESRIQFRRTIKERVDAVAPFLHYDDDPYITLIDGKLYWILDAYVTSSYYPYSEPFNATETIEYRQGEQTRELQTRMNSRFDGANYIRNSVKVVVDAYNGDVDLYIYDNKDPVIQVWQKIFPDLFKSRKEMDDAIKNHVRYPADLLLVQGLVYAKYHMTDPTVFYNQEDLWIRATEKYYDRVLPVEPYYVMWEMPESDNPEFILMLPFTPKNRQVLIGWIAGMSDPENYGRFLAYKFPKERRMLGTQQVETKIDQDSYLSGQLSLWDQRGSSVIRGNVLVIPVEETLFYVEPIYLQAETAAYPELRLVVVMHNDQISYAETFDEALEGLFKAKAGEQPTPTGRLDQEISVDRLVQQANEAFESYLENLAQKNFQQSARSLEQLQQILKRLSNPSE